MLVESINKILALATVCGNVAFVLLAIHFVLHRNEKHDKLLAFIGERGLLLAWLTALAGLVFSLFYSQIAGYPPCNLCWYQRIFLYPQAIILGMAWFKRDLRVIEYALVLTIIGFIFALYHTYIYYGGSPFFACDALATGVSCTRRYVFEFGYVTIPIMSLTSFVYLIIFLILQKRSGTIAEKII